MPYNITKKNGGTDTKTMDQTEPHFLSDPMSDRKKKFSPTLRQEVRFCLIHGLCVCPTIFFCNVIYNLSNLFFIQNLMQDYLYIVMNIKQLNSPKMKVKGYMYPQMKKPVGMLLNRGGH
jgi:hypothetical protein